MIFQQILNKDSGLSTRAKLNSMLSALIQSDEGVNAVWVFLKSLEQAMQTLSSKEDNDVADLRDSLSGANDYTDKAVNKLYTYVDAMNGGVGGLIDSTSYDPSGLPTDKPCTLIALGSGTFTNLKDSNNTAITVSQPNSITVFFRAAHITYWNYKTEVLTAPPMDATPTDGNTTHVVSSDGVYDFVMAHGIDNVDVADVTGSDYLKDRIMYSMRKNMGTASEPDYEIIAEFTIPIATATKAGLMPAYVDGVFDVNRYVGSNTPYDSLSQVLNNAATLIPTAVRRGGMSIKFIQSSDNKYVQCRCMAQDFTTDATQWQGVDPYPIKDSHNLLESDGAFQIKEEANFTQGFVGTTYKFEQIKVDTTGGTYGRKRAYIPRIGYKETFKFTVIAANGASLDENSISLYGIASNDSTYLVKSDLSLNEEFAFTTTFVGGLGFAIQVSSGDVISSGSLTLKIEKVNGTVFDLLDLRSTYYVNLSGGKVPTVVLNNNNSFTVTIPACSLELGSYTKTKFVAHAFDEAETFTINHHQALYWYIKDNTLSVDAVSSQNAQRHDAIALLANSNGIPYGLLTSSFISKSLADSNIILNNVVEKLTNKDGGVYNISEANPTNDNPTEYATLEDALGTKGANVPSAKRYPGMNIKFIQATLADYNVVKVTGLSEAPSGATLLASTSTVGNGVFKASQLSDFATLPASIGNVAVYYIAVTETVDEQEVTTYTSWTITKISNNATNYVQYRYIATSTANADFVILTNWQGVDDGITPNSIDLVKGKDVFNLLDSKNLNIGDVTGEYIFEGIFASKTTGTGYVTKLLGSLGVNSHEKIILKVVPADVNGATIKDGTIDLRMVAQSGSTYSFANVSLNQQYEFSTTGAGPKGFCIRITRENVIKEGYVTLICKRVNGSLYNYISRSSIVIARFQGEKVPSIIRTADLRFSITFQATTANVYSLNMQPYSFTLSEDTTFEVKSYQGVYLNAYDNTLFKASIGASNTLSKAAILLFGVYNNTPFGVLANYYFSERARTFESDISDINDELSDINDELSDLIDGIPSYFVDNVSQAIAKIKTNMAAVGRNGESFIFISDMHWDTNVKNSHKLVRKILDSTNLIDVLSTGDLINESRDKSVMATALIDCVKAFSFNGHPLITTRGNHDDNSNWASQEDRDAYSFTFNEYYSYFMKQMEGLVTFIGTDDSFYYDKPETKTRYIFLDSARNGTIGGNTGAVPNAVNLLNATEAGWKVVFIQHFPTGVGMNAIKAMVDGCNDRSNAKVIPSYGITADFSNAQCECVAIFAGHTHADGSSTTDGGVPIIIIDTDCLNRKTASERAEWRGTYNEQCFDVVTMDYVNKTIKCVRVGRGIDRTFTY